MKWWEMLFQMWSKSVIVSGCIALLLTGVSCYCVIEGRPIPDFFAMAFGVVVGYFFSEKTRTGTVDSNKELIAQVKNGGGSA